MSLIRPLTLVFLLSVPALPGVAAAQSKLEEEATRQLQFARSEIEEGNYEKALTSSDSAMRLNPALYDAYIYRALAYEGLGDNKVAEGLLITYLEVNTVPGAEAEELGEIEKQAVSALERVQGKLGEPGGWGQALVTEGGESGAGGSGAPIGLAAPADMPDYPTGSEAFLEWMVARQQWDVYETRTQVGVGLGAGGLALAGLGGGLVGAMSGLSVATPNDANIEAFYAAGIATMFVGGTMAAIGLPMLGINASRLDRMRKASAAKGAHVPRVEFGGAGFALRF